MANKYLHRVVDDIFKFRLESVGAVLVTGPKWCGKSTTALRHAKSSVLLQTEEADNRTVAMARLQPARLLEGPVPRLIDEWQTVPSLWDAVRHQVDMRGEMGQFILTGSAVPPATSEILHSGIGRIAGFQMRTLSLYESLESNGKVSLGDLFAGKDMPYADSSLTLDDYAFAICRGGWPVSIGAHRDVALQQAVNYCDGLIRDDVSRLDDVKRAPDRVRALLRSYGRLTATQANYSKIAADMEANEDNALNVDTLAAYINALKRLFVVEELEAWHPVLLRKQTLRTSNTRFFTDPSIACAALEIGPDDLMRDMPLFGLFFENLVIRDLRVYAQALNGHVSRFRDANGLEADAVVHLWGGAYGLVEVKLYRPELIDQGAESLKKVASRIDTDKMKKPSFLAVVTATPYAYRRPDGVFVIPLACLKPGLDMPQ